MEPFLAHNNDSRIRLFNADCVSGMRSEIDPGSVDVIVTSPPYNLGTSYGSYDDRIPRESYLDWLTDWTDAASVALSDSGSVFMNVGSKPSDPQVPFQVLERLQTRFQLQNVIHWVKSISIQKEDVGDYPGIVGNIGVGHFKPINSPRYLNDCHEYIFHLSKSGSVPLDRLAIGVEYQDKSNVSRWKSAGADLRCRGNTWFVPYKTIQRRDKQRPHPATFPAKIPAMCYKLHGLERLRTAMDPFLGIGNAALASMELNVDFIGFETDPDYFRESCKAVTDASDVTEAVTEAT